MTHLTLTLNNYLAKPLEVIINFLTKVFQAIEAAQLRRAYSIVRTQMMSHKMYRDTYNELSKLSDRELKDIGLCRGDIHSIAMESYYDNLVERNPNLKGWV